MADDREEIGGIALHDSSRSVVQEKTGGLLATNQSVTDPDGAFHCACTNSNIVPPRYGPRWID